MCEPYIRERRGERGDNERAAFLLSVLERGSKMVVKSLREARTRDTSGRRPRSRHNAKSRNAIVRGVDCARNPVCLISIGSQVLGFCDARLNIGCAPIKQYI